MPRASLRSVLLIWAFNTARMCRVSTQITGKPASASVLNSHCDSGPASSPIRLILVIGAGRISSTVLLRCRRLQDRRQPRDRTVHQFAQSFRPALVRFGDFGAEVAQPLLHG